MQRPIVDMLVWMRVELAGASVFAGSASWPTLQGELRVPLLLVEPRSAGRPFVYFDLDRDGVLSADERLSFGRGRNRYGRGELRVMLPAPAGSAFQRFPVVLQLPMMKSDSRTPPINATCCSRCSSL